jgi:hypothetical protein
MKSVVVVLSVLSVCIANGAFGAAVTFTHMFGLLTPALADTNGDGTATGADAPITPQRTGPTTITLANPWQVGIDPKNTFTLSNPDISGKFQMISRAGGGGVQSLMVTGFTPGGAPSAFSMHEMGSHGLITGNGQLLDANLDGIFDGVSGSNGGSVNFSLSFVYVDTNGDGFADYISIPWSQAGLVGVNFRNTVNGGEPQVFVPLADTNGDGKGDAIIFDLNGDGVPDADLFSSGPGTFGPVSAPASLASVPALSEWVMLFMVLTLTATALWQLRRMQSNSVRL